MKITNIKKMQTKEADRQTPLGILLILLLFGSMYLGTNFVLDVGIKISPTDIAILILLFLSPRIKHFNFKINKYTVILLMLIFIGFLLEMLSVVVVDNGDPENITLGIALLRNAVLIFLISQINYDYKKLSRWIVILGVFSSIVAIAGYVKAVSNYAVILSNKLLWHPGIFYSLDNIGVLRLQGFRENPNFFFLINLIPLFLSISIMREKKNLFSVLMFAIILTASLLTFSLTGTILLGLLLLIIILHKFNLKKLLLIFVVSISIIIISNYIANVYEIPGHYKVIISRFAKAVETGGSSRIHLWKTAWDGFQESVIFGQGGRYVLRETGVYAHNDYLEMLSSHGLTGFTFMAMLYLYILFFIKTRYRSFKDNYLFTSSSLLFIFMLIASFSFTIYYSPLIWFPVALIFSKQHLKI